ncbi:uncharacterized protein LOC112047554 [Bicyclus anynana]|uniref:Uncharacterized protein LOC112047554 n=1 Tax=Bicyclus anynana TaxID=110368 RepID=A0ABM3LSD6_BICAN|nr:uncharacterized protein LOC112047554 [Bicyclus anynana]XP_052741968.1 uncharacterized protein LOC112047554 [Bicyclus anynana]XP_052741969.1 uncharacterized protein LOC112047554 [Bicyclus anynana]XP_052741970.1 uncharacterized protein LOC112047554 [Bicyclus anynana]XP_052741971.1 uncharacterized protein LOC112047554 [Bicyclus anynana]XP_052741972.1 uncharacterized protein LOC112047554 [Bicyclus anynana]XP_052741973.1 uncharacterized protein LOC112047554 [Bicyclus anynana]XP_052741974.1 unc
MDKRTTSYNRVMPRVYNRSHPSFMANSKVTRHESSTRVGAKASCSNLGSSVFRELPLVLSGYEPEQPVDKSKVPKYGAKPKRTIKSQDPCKSPLASVRKVHAGEINRPIRAHGSAPCVTDSGSVGWSEHHLKQCYSSRSHTRIKELKDEIKAFQKTQKLMQLRSHLYKKCGVVLDDVGQVAEDKAVQAQAPDIAPGDNERKERREDAGAVVSDEQMRRAVTTPTPYPVDRYLVESRKEIDMVNIIDDDIWNPKPTLRPEDEILLGKLHDMLQTTADDLKLLSGELSKYREPGIQVRTLPTPLDEEFNKKIHIEEVVNAKFYGNQIVDRTQPIPIKNNVLRRENVDRTVQMKNVINNRNNAVNKNVQADKPSMLKRQQTNKKLQLSRTNIIEIKEQPGDEQQLEMNNKQNNIQEKRNVTSPAVAYKEVSHEYNIKPTVNILSHKSLQVQSMPSINIRSELRLQNVLQLDILPVNMEIATQEPLQQNALVIEMKYEPPLKQKDLIKFDNSQYISINTKNRSTMRKVSTMTAYESSESNNISSDSHQILEKEVHNIPPSRRSFTINQKVMQNQNKSRTNRKSTCRPQAHIEEWKRKLNTVYGRPAKIKTTEVKRKAESLKKIGKNTEMTVKTKEKNVQQQMKSGLNSTEYIPYSKLTVGGVNASDIEREICKIPNKNNIALSPILDKILSSRENSFHNDSPRKDSKINSPKILTTSDENLLQEVLDIEKKVKYTLNNNNNNTAMTSVLNNVTKDDSYADDFEDEKTDVSNHTQLSKSQTSKSSQNLPSDYSVLGENDKLEVATEKKMKTNERTSDSNLTFTKVPNLSLKNKVDVFEFVHSLDTHETGTQSNTTNKIIPKETQTSPRDDKPTVQPIHNELWPSIDPRGEVEKMLKLEKEFIKKLIIDEYGDLLEKSLNKPSTSEKTHNESRERNVAASQKITQTSPAHVKSVMTSPTRTKTRTTSPFALSVTVYQQTSPAFYPGSNSEELNIDLGNDDDLGISANLSSPRFSLRLPQTSREVLSKLEFKLQNNKKTAKYDNLRKNVFSSSSSVDGDYSSTDISSLGEINKKFKRLRKSRIHSISEISSTSSQSKYNSDALAPILPLKSEGEASAVRMHRKKTNKHSKSEGEVSLGQLH